MGVLGNELGTCRAITPRAQAKTNSQEHAATLARPVKRGLIADRGAMRRFGD